jgi:hypothetical protein
MSAQGSAVLVGGGWHLVRAPSQGYVAGRQDSLTMVSNLSKERCPCAGGVDTSNIALRVVGGDEKGTQCLGI